MEPYTTDFYVGQKHGSRQSAEEIIPMVLKMIQPKSVIDIGCGVGTWLSVFREYGIEDFMGVDGDYVDKRLLQIPQNKFVPADLTSPFHINRQFDLAITLEVAEHLPHEKAEQFVNGLVKLAPIVLFSAAIPFQGGTKHINEQWPDFWNDLFKKHQFVVIDALRKRIWNNDKVDFWYRQNVLLFVKEERLAGDPLLKKEREGTSEEQLSIVHPQLYNFYCKEIKVDRIYVSPLARFLKYLNRLKKKFMYYLP